MRRRDLLAGLSFVPLAAPAVAQCVVPTFPRINLPGRCEADGGPPATLDLSFMTPGTLDPRVTFTRSTTATYFDSAGVMQTAGVNVPRWDYDPGTLALRGLLIEEARTNLMLQSANLTVAPWGLGGLIVAAPTVTANNVVAPDGTTTGTRIVYPQVIGAGAVSYVRQFVTVPAAVHAYTVYLRGAVGGEQLYLACVNTTPLTYYRALVTLTTAWQRFTLVSGTLTNTEQWNFTIGTDLRDGGQTTKPAQTIYAWGAHVETGPFASSYIPTVAAAVTRTRDVATMPLAVAAGSALTLAADFAMQGFSTTVNQFPATIDDGTGANRFALIRIASTTELRSVNTSGLQITAGTLTTAGVLTKLASAWSSSIYHTAANGAAPISTTPSAPTAMNTLRLGENSTANGTLGGWMSRVRFWTIALSATDLRTVTA